jgi:menaquinol-cytochrome c reductase iron-sulfur subunit
MNREVKTNNGKTIGWKNSTGIKGDSGLCKGNQSSRRDFLLKVGIGLNIAAGVMVGIPVIGYVFSSFIKRPKLHWIALGETDSFPEEETRLSKYRNPNHRPWDGAITDIPCWVRRLKGDVFQVFAINCTHLGCPVRWFAESKLFFCPCHGGVYYQDGSRAAGPPPRGLFEYETKIEEKKLWIKGGILPTLANTP